MNTTQPFSAEPSFEPELAKFIFGVCDEVFQTLGDIAWPRIVHEAIVRQILEAVEEGERDPDRIYQRALGVVAAAKQQQSAARRAALS
jgi:hypothetical protein